MGVVPMEGAVGAGARKETAMQGLLRKRMIGWVCSSSHDIDVHRSCQLRQAHIRLPAFTCILGLHISRRVACRTAPVGSKASLQDDQPCHANWSLKSICQKHFLPREPAALQRLESSVKT